MNLPRLVVLTDRTQLPAHRDLVSTIMLSAEAGLTHVVLRELDLSDAERTELARRLASHVHVIAARGPMPGAHGVHLAASQPAPKKRVGLTGRSCHTTAEVRRAAEASVDYLTISPVAATRSKPGYGPALGTRGVRRAVENANGVPVYALGGVGVANAGDMRSAGAHGVAVMGELMRSTDPGALVVDLLEALR